MSESLRLFFAVPIDDTTRSAVVAVRDELRKLGGPVKWVEDENLHFTLKFLGEMPEILVERIEAVARQVAARHEAFDLALTGAGAFPDVRAPRVIWIGAEEGQENLASLADDLDGALEKAAISPREKRPFAAHLTLGRIKFPARRDDLTEAIERLKTADGGRFRCDHFVLMRSELSRRGPTYTQIQRFLLGGAEHG
jgi:2'-5' RNA ligase